MRSEIARIVKVLTRLVVSLGGQGDAEHLAILALSLMEEGFLASELMVLAPHMRRNGKLSEQVSQYRKRLAVPDFLDARRACQADTAPFWQRYGFESLDAFLDFEEAERDRTAKRWSFALAESVNQMKALPEPTRETPATATPKRYCHLHPERELHDDGWCPACYVESAARDHD